MEPLYLAWTMDCERIAAESPPGGPATWELSERAIRGYCDTLLAAGAFPTLFLTPECAVQHRAMFRDYAKQGVELGLHVHPQSFAEHQYEKYLGEYDADTQRKIISEAMAVFADAIGWEPRSFRAGNDSATDDTFRVLSELGFLAGSVSCPGREVPKYAARWETAYRYAHWAHRSNRLVPGDLPFFEVPMSTHPTERSPDGLAHELRIEWGPLKDWQQPIIEAVLADMETNRVAFKSLCFITHNTFAYDDASAPQSQTLRDTLAFLRTLAPRFTIKATTLTEAREAFRAMCPV
ncbi:MAG TPA: polysaccharide deacetylase family protein [Candidatus Latescibacteria bacterium]|nr:polysaccharide deacetylase family protein [Candidatus Latescibacterota bacterium]HOF61512.1 polysaccharide deacetylase family protein [Candidatus Latescibacterota bacterium]HOS63904.1 polysaccharide deacetylase family protein [Candidatus Latescibacterota bacterium]HPK73807.1 polysaccharide deacetylase family protein [Candidatus Latescibacterota bacterium]